MTIGKEFIAGVLIGALIMWLLTLPRPTPPTRESKFNEWRRPVSKSA